jgi:hypothetical protein
VVGEMDFGFLASGCKESVVSDLKRSKGVRGEGEIGEHSDWLCKMEQQSAGVVKAPSALKESCALLLMCSGPAQQCRAGRYS